MERVLRRMKKPTELKDWLDKEEIPSTVLTSREICSIIKVASESGVQALEYAGLKLSFLEKSTQQTTQVRDFWPENTNSFAPPRKMGEQALEKQHRVQGDSEAAFLKQEMLDEEERDIDQLLVLRPEEYEERISNGELSETEDDK